MLPSALGSTLSKFLDLSRCGEPILSTIQIRSMFLRSSPADITSGDALSQCSRFLLTWHKHAC